MSKKPMGDECIMLTSVLQNLNCVYMQKPPPVIKFSFLRVWAKILQNVFHKASGRGETIPACRGLPRGTRRPGSTGLNPGSRFHAGSSRAELSQCKGTQRGPIEWADAISHEKSGPPADTHQGTRRTRIPHFSK